MFVLRCHQLSFSYGYFPLFENLSFELSSGQALWLEGPNGSGKTSLLKCLAGLANIEAGDITWQNRPMQHAEIQPHWLGHKTPIKDHLTGLENLKWLCESFTETPRSDSTLRSALEQVGLDQAMDQPCKHYSMGMKRRVLLAKLICLPSPLWLLDEPINALDQAGIALFEQMCRQHLSNQGLIIFSSHLPLNPIEPEQLIRMNLANLTESAAC